jgi:hypothetical protein
MHGDQRRLPPFLRVVTICNQYSHLQEGTKFALALMCKSSSSSLQLYDIIPAIAPFILGLEIGLEIQFQNDMLHQLGGS